MESRDDRIFEVRLKKQERPAVGGPEPRRTRRHGQGAAVVALISVGWSCREMEGDRRLAGGAGRPLFAMEMLLTPASQGTPLARQLDHSKPWRIWGLLKFGAVNHGGYGGWTALEQQAMSAQVCL